MMAHMVDTRLHLCMCACAEGHQHRQPIPLFFSTRKWTKRQDVVFSRRPWNGWTMFHVSEAYYAAHIRTEWFARMSTKC